MTTAASWCVELQSDWQQVAKYHFHRKHPAHIRVSVLQNDLDRATGTRHIRREFSVASTRSDGSSYVPSWLAHLLSLERVRFVEDALINERDRTMELRSRNRDFEWLGLAEERTLLATPAAGSDGGGIDGGGRDATSSSPASASGDGGEGTVWRQQGGVRCSRWVAGPLAPSVERLAVRIFTGVGQEALRKKDSEVGEWLAEWLLAD